MKIAIDFDMTIANTKVLVDEYIKKYYPDKSFEDFYTIDPEVNLDLYTKFGDEITSKERCFVGVKDAFEFMEKHKIKKYLVTKRGIEHQNLIPATMKYLEKRDLKFDAYLYNSEFKGAVCLANDIDLLIDDNEEVLKEAKEKGVKVLKFGSPTPEFDYAENWNQVIEYLKKGLK